MAKPINMAKISGRSMFIIVSPLRSSGLSVRLLVRSSYYISRRNLWLTRISAVGSKVCEHDDVGDQHDAVGNDITGEARAQLRFGNLSDRIRCTEHAGDKPRLAPAFGHDPTCKYRDPAGEGETGKKL